MTTNEYSLLGWNAVKNRVQQLSLDLTDDEVKEVTAQIKKLADVRPQSIEDVDLLLKNFHRKDSLVSIVTDEGVENDD